MFSEKSNGAERREIKGAEGDVDKADQKADYADDLEKVSCLIFLLSLNIIYFTCVTQKAQ